MRRQPSYPILVAPPGYPVDLVAQLRQPPLSSRERCPYEEAEHRAVVDYLDVRSRLGDFHEQSWFHPPMGEIRNKATAGKLWSLGARSGPSDIIILARFELRGATWAGLIIELKRSQPAPWKLSPAQRDFLEASRVEGYVAEVCHGAREAQRLVEACYGKPGARSRSLKRGVWS